MLETRKVDNNKMRKALFVNLRPLAMYALLRSTRDVS